MGVKARVKGQDEGHGYGEEAESGDSLELVTALAHIPSRIGGSAESVFDPQDLKVEPEPHNVRVHRSLQTC